MALNERLVSELVRQRLGMSDASQSARFINLIPDALKVTARKIAADRFLRHLLISNKSTTFLAISAVGDNGKVALATAYANFHLLLEYLDYGELFLTDVEGEDDNVYPLQKLASAGHASLPQQLNDFDYYWIEGDFLYVKDADNGNIRFACPYFPTTLAELPESQEVETMFISKLIELANMPSDAAEDGEK